MASDSEHPDDHNHDDPTDDTEDADEDAPSTPNGTNHQRRLRNTVTALSHHVQWLTTRLDHAMDRLDALDGAAGNDHARRTDQPAPWVLYTPPAAAEDTIHRSDGHDPTFTVGNFIAWYNTIYVGNHGSRSAAIPPCWHQHPALAAEIATLAYTWREANIGPNANARDAQHWHDRWRPAFTERLTTDWTHPHCHTHNHRQVGAAERATRFIPRTTSHPERRHTGQPQSSPP